MAQNNGFTVWLTGMSCTGKTSLANYIAARLRQVGRQVEVLDEGDLAEELWAGQSETKEERIVAMRRLGFVAKVLSRNNVATLVAAVSPYKQVRDEIRKQVGRHLEVYVDCPTEQLIQRDSSGKYKKALHGEIPNFIGITEPYEPPSSPEVTVHSDTESVEAAALRIFQALLDLAYVSAEDLKTITGKKMKANPLPKKGAARREAKPAKAAKGTKTRPAARAARVASAKKPAPAKRKR